MVAFGMHAAFLLGGAIILAMVIADRVAFSRKNSSALGYGFAVSRHEEILQIPGERFDRDGNLPLPRGLARLCPDRRAIVLLPDWKRFGVKLRTAWPLNGAIYYTRLGEPSGSTFVKRMPWSSALLTGVWFLTVAGGVVVYLVSYAQAGGFRSATGAFLGVALSGLGLLVLLFGLMVVVAGYRLEDKRLMEVYEELRAALANSPP